MRLSSINITYGGFYSPPFMEYGEQGCLQGPLIELAVQIAKYFHLTPTFENLSQEQLNSFYNSGIDVGLGVFEAQSRKVLGDFSYPIIRLGLQGLGLKNYGALGLCDLEEKNLRFGVKEGEIGHDFLMNNYGSDWVSKNCHIIPATSSLDSRNLLESHECDVILCDTLTLKNWRNEITLSTWLTFTKPIFEINMCFLISSASPVSVDDINHWLALHANTRIYNDFIASVWSKNETAYKPCLIPPA